MGRKEKVSAETKLLVVQEYLSGSKGAAQISYELQISDESFRMWLIKYETQGANGLLQISKNTHYPEYFKLQAVTDFISGKSSLLQICKTYGISSTSVLRKWIKKYNGHEPMKSQNSIGGKIMANGRKTTYEERVEIVSYCIANNENYQLASEKYQVSYQQVYIWVKKYQRSGPEALADRRGKRKNPNDMTEAEKLAAQIKLLEAENKRLQLEVGFLKKLEEVERRRTGKTNIQLLKNTPRKPGSR